MASLSFFLLDINYRITAGKAIIYLYGRTKDGKQLCVKDAGFEPYFYVVPNDGKDAIPELEGLTLERGKVVRVERVKKNLTEKEIDVLKVFVDLPNNVPALRDHIRQFKSVKHVLEADILFVRRYLIDKQLTPMTLVRAECTPSTEPSRVEIFDATDIKQDGEDTLAQPRILAVDIETYNPLGKRVLPQEHPILMIALYGENFKKVLTWKNVKHPDVDIERVGSESEMLERFKQHIADFKPDVLAGYYSDGFDLPYVKTRADKYKIKLDMSWDHSEMRFGGRENQTCQFTGLVHLDVLRFIRQVMGRSMKTDTFSLNAVSAELLGDKKADVDIEGLADAWDREDPSLADFAFYNLHDAKLTHDLLVKVLPNMIEMVKIVGLPIWDVTRMTFSQLVEWFIIKQAFAANELAPNKPGFRDRQDREHKRFQGAFVFEPTPGLYDDIAVFDYRSLYPSIIASHNISPGMLNCACCEGKDVVPGTEMWYCTRRRGFISRIIEDIITRRARIKELLKKDKSDPLLAARSESLKVLANSFYGYLGFAPARWYCFECGQAVTAWGRHHIHDVIDRAKKDGFKVIYSDTDSIFLQLEKKTKQDAVTFVEEVNASLPGLMELDFEAFYPAGLFVSTKSAEGGAKKRYALLDEKGKLKIRGFEVVRRNVSPVAKRTQELVLRTILADKDPQKAQALVKAVVADLQANRLPLHDVIITTALTKEIGSYESIGPHVAAAQRMKDRGTEVGAGTRITYVVIKGKGRIRDNVRLPEEITQADYDGEYYVEHQVVPAVEKIFEVVGIDLAKAITSKSQSTLGSF
jgi:DNA polymerase elongation subunit (family B)